MASGKDILLAGLVGAGMTRRLMEEHGEEIERYFPGHFIKEARCQARFAIDEETRDLISRFGAAEKSRPVKVAEGGIFRALWDLAEQEEAGLESAFEKIPIRQEFLQILNFLDEDPYRGNDGGSILIALEDGRELIRELEKRKIPACLIGRLTEGRARRIARGETYSYLNKPEELTDEK